MYASLFMPSLDSSSRLDSAVCYNTRSRRGGKEGFRDKPNLLVRNLPILMVISVNNFVTDCFLLVSLVDSFMAVLFNL